MESNSSQELLLLKQLDQYAEAKCKLVEDIASLKTSTALLQKNSTKLREKISEQRKLCDETMNAYRIRKNNLVELYETHVKIPELRSRYLGLKATLEKMEQERDEAIRLIATDLATRQKEKKEHFSDKLKKNLTQIRNDIIKLKAEKEQLDEGIALKNQAKQHQEELKLIFESLKMSEVDKEKERERELKRRLDELESKIKAMTEKC